MATPGRACWNPAPDRRRTASWPARVSYPLTERGYALLPVLRAMWDWGTDGRPGG
ncbi:winged helix-turn-helix transcriptional regulator [Micromonospora sp. MS34]|uniref:winged helix-turn-helix transcriptional regulator n=1 Tax=Micromonospora sp. MS34 TaxID=3385971 RepID=UPI0039A28828